MISRRRLGYLVTAVLASSLMSATVQAQSCEANRQGACTFGNTATEAISLTITAAVRLDIGAAQFTLPGPTGLDFDAALGAPLPVAVTVRSNTNWVLTLRAASALWAATGAEARADRPAADLLWASSETGTYGDLTETDQTVASGAATASFAVPLWIRARFAWDLDAPGSYTLPLQLTITAP